MTTSTKKPKNKRLNVKVDGHFVARINEAASVLNVPYSQIVRTAVDEKLEMLAQTNPTLKAALAALPAAA